MTTWTTDHCGCKVELDGTPVAVTAIYSQCVDHIGLDMPTMTTVLLQENRTKNYGFQAMLSGDAGTNLISQIGESGVREFKGGFISYQYTGVAPNRTLQVSVSGINLTVNQKSTFTNFINNAYGGAYSGRIQLI